MKKLTLILALLLLTQAAACGGDASSADDTTAAGGDTAPAETSDPRLSIADDLPDKDFGGCEFRVMYCSYGKGAAVDPYAPEEATGDVVDDAIFERNSRIEERFNVKIVSVDDPSTSWSTFTNAVKTQILAADDSFDIVMNHIIGGPNNSLEGAYVNLYDLDHIDFAKPWWSAQMVDEMTVKGQMYVCGDVMGLGLLKSGKVHYINKGKFEEYKLKLPYDEIFAGTWTLDKLISLTKDVYNDVNGNAAKDLTDFYGYVSHCNHNGFLTSCDTPVLAKDEDGTLTITANTEKTANLIEKLGDWYFDAPGSLIIDGSNPETGDSESVWQAKLFAEGRALVGFAKVQDAATTFRESNVEYGIIPFPKYDENQADYITFAGGDLMSVPVTNPDLERTGILIEAIAAETWKTVVPAYFSTALKEKFTFDSESGQTLDIINDSLTISFAYCYDNWKGFGHMCGTLFSGDGQTSDYASFYAGRISSAEARLKLITDFFASNEK